MKKLVLLLCCVLLNAEFSNEFNSYPTKLYQCKYKIPQNYKCKNGECRDLMNKLVDLSINFAGKYSIIAHSCGTGCRFYSMLNLENAEENFEILSQFNTTPDTSNKDDIDILLSQSDSKLLIVQHQYNNGTCKQEKFIFDNEKLKPLGNVESCKK